MFLRHGQTREQKNCQCQTKASHAVNCLSAPTAQGTPAL
jgi:hypothetical protein